MRAYTGAPVPRHDLETIVDAGRLAASGYNRQPCEFIVITDPATLADLNIVAAWLAGAGAVIAVAVDPQAEYWLEDASAAIQNMLVAATALGYGSCWLEGATKRNEATLKERLGVPDTLRLLTLVPVGLPASWPAKEKRPLADVVHWERY